MAKYDDNDGVWRTIGGRRVFIKKGQSMSDAMKESGKFKIANKKIESKSNSSTDSKIKQLYHDTWNAKKDYKELKDELDKLKNSGDATQEDIDRVKKEAQKEFNSSKKEENEKKNEYTKEEYKTNKYEKAEKEMLEKDRNINNIINQVNHTYGNINKTDFENEVISQYAIENNKNGFIDDDNKDYGKEWENGELETIRKKVDKFYEKKINKDISSTSEKEYQLFKKATENPDSIDAMTENSTDWEKLDSKYRTRYDNERLEIAKDIAKELYAMNDEHPRLEKQAKEILEPSDGYVLDDNETFYTNKDGNIELSTETLTEWRDRLKKGYNNVEETLKDKEVLEKHNLADGDPSFKRQMLGRMESDINYYLGNGNGNERHLWAGNEDDHIQIMKSLYNTLPDKEKPEWLTMDKINDYEKQMKEVKGNSSLISRYAGTIDYMKNSTGLNMSQIIEIIKKMDKDRNK